MKYVKIMLFCRKINRMANLCMIIFTDKNNAYTAHSIATVQEIYNTIEIMIVKKFGNVEYELIKPMVEFVYKNILCDRSIANNIISECAYYQYDIILNDSILNLMASNNYYQSNIM